MLERLPVVGWVGVDMERKKEQEHNPNDQEEKAGDSRKFKTCLKKKKQCGI